MPIPSILLVVSLVARMSVALKSGIQVCKALETTSAADSESGLPDDDGRGTINVLSDGDDQNVGSNNNFRQRDYDSTSEESYGRPVVANELRDPTRADDKQDVEAQTSFDIKLKRILSMNLTSNEKAEFISMLYSTVQQPSSTLYPFVPMELVKHPILDSFNQGRILKFIEEYQRYLLNVKNNHPQRPKTMQDCLSTPLLQQIAEQRDTEWMSLTPAAVEEWVHANAKEDQKLSVEEIKSRFKSLCMNPGLAPRESVQQYFMDFQELVRKTGTSAWFYSSSKTKKLRHTILTKGIRPTCLKEQVTNLILKKLITRLLIFEKSPG